MISKNKLTAPVFLFLLPVFFVLHQYTAHYKAIPAGGSLFLVLIYLVASGTIAALAWIFFRDLHKAALMAFLIMSFYFFYGTIKDFLWHQFPGSFLNRYRFIVPFTLLLFAIIFASLKRRKRPLTRFGLYMNVLLLTLVVFEACLLSVKVFAKKPAPAVSGLLTTCDTCSKPDIYLIIADGYASNKSLNTHFGFDNAAFENKLRQRGFFIAGNSTSNYNFTLYSMPSILNMEYIKDGQPVRADHAYNLVRENVVTNFLTKIGYRFYNCSLFDIAGESATTNDHFIPTGTEIITSQTLINRLENDFMNDLLGGMFGGSLQKKYAYASLDFNDNILSLTRDIAVEKTGDPKFVYTHLLMPHYPYYYDSAGKLSTIDQLENTKNYTGYLQYANGKILDLIDHIFTASEKPPVIVLMGDHGFRHPEVKLEASQSFLNLNAVCLPRGNYTGFYDSISGVNQFRVLLNNRFNQHLPLLKDSMVVIAPGK